MVMKKWNCHTETCGDKQIRKVMGEHLHLSTLLITLICLTCVKEANQCIATPTYFHDVTVPCPTHKTATEQTVYPLNVSCNLEIFVGDASKHLMKTDPLLIGGHQKKEG